MASEALLRIKVIADTAAAAAGMNNVDKSAGKMRRGLSAAAVPAAAAGAAVIAFGKASYDAASRSQQAMGGVEAVFGKSASQVKKWSDQSADSVGLAAAEYAELATVMGAQLKNMGVPMDQVAKKSDNLIRMGADMAATFGGTSAEAVAALSSALKGETDPIEKYGVGIKQADIAARMAAEGTDKLEGAQLKQAKTATLLKMITEQTKDAHGAFAREADTAAGASQRTAAKMEDMQASLGAVLLPVISKAVEWLGKLFTWMEKNQTVTQVLIGVIGAIAAAIVVMNVALAVTALIASPIALVAVAIVAIGVALVVAYNKVGWFRNWVDAQFQGIKTIVMAVARFLVTAWTQAVNVVRAVVRGVSNAWATVSGAVKTAVRAVTSFVTSTWTSAVNTVRTAVTRVTDAWSSVVGAVKGIVSDVTGFIKSAWTAAMQTVTGAIRAWQGVASGIFGAVQNALNRVWDVFKGLGSKIKGLLTGASGWLTSVGVDIVRGLVDGINSVIDWVQNAVENLAGKVPQWVKNKLGISSPSKVMAEIGQEIMAGLGLGMEQMAPEVEATSKAVADKVTASITRSFERAALAALPKKATDAQKSRAVEQAGKKAVQLGAKVLATLKDEYALIQANTVARELNAEALKKQEGILEQLIQQHDSYAASVRESAQAYGALTTATVAEGEAFTSAGLVKNMADRLKAVNDFRATLDTLRAQGLSEQTLADLTAAGVETGGAMAAALAAGGPAAVAEVTALQGQLDAASTTLGTNAAAGLYGAGVAAQQGLVNGLKISQETLDAEAVTLANSLAAAVETALKNAKVDDAADAYAKRLAKAIRKALRDELAKDGNGGGGGNSGNGRSVLHAVPTVAGATTAPRVANPRATAQATSSTGPTIIVNGAIDPEATARQIRRILTGHDRRMGLTG